MFTVQKICTLFTLTILSCRALFGAYGDEQLDALKNALIFETENQQFYLETGLQFDWTGYYTDNSDNNPPGFFFRMMGSVSTGARD